MLPFFTWPYPFLLSVQHFISDPAGGRSWLAGLGLGFVVVLACSRVAQFVLRQKRLTVIQQWAVALLSVVLPLGGVTGIAWGVARAAGWPVGE